MTKKCKNKNVNITTKSHRLKNVNNTKNKKATIAENIYTANI